MPFDASGRILYVAQRGQARREARLEAIAITAGAALIVGLLCVLWMRARVRRELAPITAMSAAVAQFDPLHSSRPGQPSTRLIAATRSDLLPMQDAINDLGTRLARRMANERAFSSHAAHALRTPLAGMVAQLAVAQRKSPPEAQEHLLRTRQAANRLQQVVTALLTLFRSGAEVKWQSVAIADLLTHLHFDKLTLTANPSALIHGDPDLLSAALMNLLDNSLRHGARQVTVSVATHSGEAGGDVLVVQDDGSGIPENKRQQLQQALDSQDYDKQMGLGLMLADLVARAHGGQLRLCPSASGCRVELRLGAAAAGTDQPD
ncbi:sensor histidine kinase [Roseateles sp. GG27B]